MNTPKPLSIAKKVLVGLVALSNAAYPLAASASQYIQMMPVHNLVVANGGALATVNVDASNTTTARTLAGNAVLKAAPSIVNFGAVLTGTQALAQTMTLSNLGGAPAVLGTLSTNAQFLVTDNCDGATLPSLGTCQVNVTFSPTQIALGGLWGTLSVPFTSGTAAATALLGLQGTAILPTGASLQTASITGFSGSDPSLTLNANGQPQISFGGVSAGQQSVSKSFSVSSNGKAPVTFSGLQFSGGSSAPGSVANGWAATSADGSYTASSNCPASVAIGTSCAVIVTFAPSSPGAKSATLNIQSSSMTGNTMQVVLAGTAATPPTDRPGFSTSSSTVNFGAIDVDSSSARQLLVLNDGNVSLSLPLVQATGTGFSASHNCPSSMAPGASCGINLTFAPSARQAYSGQVSVQFSNASVQSATLDGSGQGALLAVDFQAQSFSSVNVGATGILSYVLVNSGDITAPVTFGSLPPTVTRTGSCLSALDVGANCTVVLTFAPLDTGTVAGSLSISSPTSTTSLSFDGMGVNPALTLTGVSPSVLELAGGAPRVQLQGSNFNSNTKVLFGEVPAVCTLDAVTQLSCAPPARATAGFVSVEVRDDTDGRTATLANAVQYVQLNVASVSLASVSTLGGQTFVVSGEGFMPGATATLKGASMPCTVTSHTQLSCVTPVSASGSGSLVVTNPAGSTFTLVSAVTYAAPISYAKLDAGKKSPYVTLSADALTATTTSSSTWDSVWGTVPKSSGKYYIEVQNLANITAIGIVGSLETSYSPYYSGTLNSGIQYLSSGSVVIGNSVATGTSPPIAAMGTTIGMAVDLGAKTLQFLFKPTAGACTGLGTSYSFSSGLYPTNPAAFFPALSLRSYGSNKSAVVNFGQNTFVCPVPSGYQPGWY